jgi:hypothetical protein
MIVRIFATAAVVILALFGVPLAPVVDEDRVNVWIRALLALFVIAAIWSLGGCASVGGEGDGFGGSNYAGTHQCSDKTPTGEAWRYCSAEEAAAQDAARRRK